LLEEVTRSYGFTIFMAQIFECTVLTYFAIFM